MNNTQNSHSPDQTPFKEQPQFEMSYKGPLVFLWFWLIWSMGGYLMLVLGNESSLFFEIAYIISAIMAVMALNNRLYGTNHRLLFFNEYFIAPKMIHLWHWNEEKIYYKDIMDIKVIPIRIEKGKIELLEIELDTSNGHYPILAQKLPLGSLMMIFKFLAEKTGLAKELAQFNEATGQSNFDKESDNTEGSQLHPNVGDNTIAVTASPWQWKLAGLALLVSFWAVVSISLAEKYHLILGEITIFTVPFVLSFVIAFMAHLKIGPVKGSAKKWQKFFLLLYLGFYGGISLTFSMIYLNGVLDHSATVVGTVPVNLRPEYDEAKDQHCLELAVPMMMAKNGSSEVSERLPASQRPAESQTNYIYFCQKDFSEADIGDQLRVSIRQGAFLAPWVEKVHLKNGQAIR